MSCGRNQTGYYEKTLEPEKEKTRRKKDTSVSKGRPHRQITEEERSRKKQREEEKRERREESRKGKRPGTQQKKTKGGGGFWGTLRSWGRIRRTGSFSAEQ